MRIRLVAPAHLAVVRLVGRVHVRVFLPIRRVGEATVAAFVLAAERLLTCGQRNVMLVRSAKANCDDRGSH